MLTVLVFLMIKMVISCCLCNSNNNNNERNNHNNNRLIVKWKEWRIKKIFIEMKDDIEKA